MAVIEKLIFAPVLLPLLGSSLAFCAKAFGRKGKAGFLEYAGAAAGLGLSWLVLFPLLPGILGGRVYEGIVGGWAEGMGIAYCFDGLAWLVCFLGTTVAMAAWIYSLGAGPRGPAFTAVFLIQTAALSATAMTVDLFNLFVCLEVMGIASYVLVASSEKPGAFLAAFSYLMVSASAMIFFLLGLYGFYRLTGSLSYSGIAAGLSALPDGGGLTSLFSLALITAAVALRVAVMPLYGWLPDAHAMAPHAVSAVLSGVLIKTPLFALSRILAVFPAGAGAGELLGFAGGATALIAVIIALSQKDAKRLLAYHSVSQIGYVVCAWGAAISCGVSTGPGLVLMTAAFLHALYHAMFKGLLFLTVGTVTDSAGERNVYRLRGGAGILRKSGEGFPVTMLTFFIAAMAISAIPPFNGFASKAALSYALKGRWEYTVLTLASIGTVASFIKLSRIFFPAGRKERAAEDSAGTEPSAVRIPLSVKLAEIFLGLCCIIFGIFYSEASVIAGRMLNPGGAAATAGALPPVLYNRDLLIKTGIIAACGLLLFFMCSTRPGKALLRIIRERPRSFRGLFVSFSLGMAGMALWLFFKSGAFFI